MRRGVVGFALFYVAFTISGCTDSPTDPDQQTPAVPASVTAVKGGGQTGVVGAILPEPLVVVVRDEAGRVIVGAQVKWEVSSGGGRVDRSTVATDSAGEAQVNWELGERTDSPQEVKATVGTLAPVVFTATAVPDRAATVTVTPASLQFNAIDATAILTATVQDRYGNVIAGHPVEWHSFDTSIAEVDNQGVVTARGVGQVDIRAQADTATKLVPVVVDPGASAGLQITEIMPAVLTPGVQATIKGTGFGATVGGNEVTVAGHAAVVLSATATQLTITVPPRELFSCAPLGQVNVTVKVGAATTFRAHPLAVARQIAPLGVGEYVDLRVDDADRGCIELPTDDAAYLISVYNTSTVHNAGVPYTLRGTAGSMVVAAPARSQATSSTAAFPAASRDFRRTAATPAVPGLPTQRRAPIYTSPEARRVHAALLDANRELIRRHGPPARRRAQDPRIATAAAPLPLTVGAMLDIRIPDVNKNVCNDYKPIRARVVYAGQRAVVLEDSVAPFARMMDRYYEDLGREFEQNMLPVLEEYFGDPFALDSVLGNTGKILMVFSPAVNEFGNVAGFVTSADFFARSSCPASDLAQIFYAVAPTWGTGTYGSPSDWLWAIRSTVIHEVKHIVSFAERLARNAAALEDNWLEESTARLAEELWGRRIFGNQYLGEAGYRETVFCELRPSWPECAELPYVTVDHFHGVYEYLKAMPELSPLGRQKTNDWTYYGSGWLLVRWALDHLAGSEAAFVKALVQENSLTGVANLEARAGKSFKEMLGPWSLSLYWDQYTAPLLSIRSWNLADIYNGLQHDIPSVFDVQYPIVGSNIGYGSIDLAESTGVRGGSAKLYRLSGNRSGTQVLELLGYPSGPVAGTLGIAVLRIQ